MAAELKVPMVSRNVPLRLDWALVGVSVLPTPAPHCRPQITTTRELTVGAVLFAAGHVAPITGANAAVVITASESSQFQPAVVSVPPPATVAAVPLPPVLVNVPTVLTPTAHAAETSLPLDVVAVTVKVCELP